MDWKIHKTDRGFHRVDFDDANKRMCSLQESSAIDTADEYAVNNPGSSFLWLGREDARMHLSREQVKSLVDSMGQWLDTGSLGITNGEQQHLYNGRR